MMPVRPAKSLATLSSGLLARKGQARPAMRSQGFGSYAPQPLDDLGWNDMGRSDLHSGEPSGDEAAPSDAEVLAQYLTDTPEIDFPEIPKPVVLRDREALSDRLAAPPAATKPVSVATATRLRRETRRKVGQGDKAAFTLRLDADRHLRLRLASAITNRSAQALVAQALDQLLSTLPEVETLVVQLPPAKGRAK